jgi:SOS response regulatory protein OraA/RecX
VFDFLLRRGFSMEIVQKTVRMFCQQQSGSGEEHQDIVED